MLGALKTSRMKIRRKRVSDLNQASESVKRLGKDLKELGLLSNSSNSSVPYSFVTGPRVIFLPLSHRYVRKYEERRKESSKSLIPS